jgi:hypothetical protein
MPHQGDNCSPHVARKRIGQMVIFDAAGQQIDREHIEAGLNMASMRLGKLVQIRRRHATQHSLLRGIDLLLRRDQIAGGARLHFEEDQGGAVPGHQVQIAGQPLRSPAAGHHRIAQLSKIKEGGIFSAFAGDQVGWLRTLALFSCPGRQAMSAKYIFVTGGVVSSLGKGLAAASIGCLLEARGIKVNLMKFDPYLNVDPGTMSRSSTARSS